MADTKNLLRLEDLHEDMHVNMEQLSNLYGVWIYFNPNTLNKDTGDADIVYFCTEDTKDDAKITDILNQYGKLATMYQPVYYEDEDNEVFDD